MHAVLFLGFMSLLLRKLQLIAIGYRESASFPNAFGGPFAAFKDAIELAVVAAVLYAFYRRFVLRPARLAPNREALLVLSLILAIMVTDFAFDGFRFALLAERFPAIAHERAYAFVGSALADGVLRAEPGGAADGLRARLLDADGRRVLLPRAAAGRRALPHRHRAAGLVLPARSTGPSRADGRRREADGGDRRGRHAGRRAQRARPHLEGRARCLHLHRMRPLQGRLPDPPHRQAAVAEGRQRPPQAPSARAARGDRRATRAASCRRSWAA